MADKASDCVKKHLSRFFVILGAEKALYFRMFKVSRSAQSDNSIAIFTQSDIPPPMNFDCKCKWEGTVTNILTELWIEIIIFVRVLTSEGSIIWNKIRESGLRSGFLQIR